MKTQKWKRAAGPGTDAAWYLLASASCFHVAHPATCGSNYSQLRQINNEGNPGICGTRGHKHGLRFLFRAGEERDKRDWEQEAMKYCASPRAALQVRSKSQQEARGQDWAGEKKYIGWRESVCLWRGGKWLLDLKHLRFKLLRITKWQLNSEHQLILLWSWSVWFD